MLPTQDWQSPGALSLPGLLLGAGLLFSVFLAAFRNPVALFRTELILMAGLVYWLVLDAIQGAYGLYDTELAGVRKVFISVTLFAAFFWLGALFASMGRRHPATSEPRFSSLGPHFVFLAAFVCGLLGISYEVMSCQFQPSCLYEAVMRESRFEPWRIDFSYGPLRRLRYAAYVTVPLTVLFFLLTRRLSWRGVILGVLVLLNLLFLLNYGRRGVGTAVGSGILIFVLAQPRIRVRHLIIMLVAAASLLALLDAMVAWRNAGVVRGIVAGRTIDTGREGLIAVDKNLLHASRAMSIVPQIHPHTSWLGLAANLGHSIPHSIWPGRPAKHGFRYAWATERKGREGWTATFSVVGDLFVIGGMIVVAMGGFVYGSLAHFTSRLLLQPPTVRNRLLFCIATMALFVSLRSLHELSATGLSVIGLVALYKLRDLVMVRSHSAPGYRSTPVSQS